MTDISKSEPTQPDLKEKKEEKDEDKKNVDENSSHTEHKDGKESDDKKEKEKKGEAEPEGSRRGFFGFGRTESQDPKWKENKWYRIKNRTKKRISLKNIDGEILETIEAGKAKPIKGARLNEIEQNSLDKFINTNQISKKELEHVENSDYIVNNLTSRRILLQHNYFSTTGLFLPAFGSRTIKGKTLLEHDYTDWENQGLIKIEQSIQAAEDQTAYGIFGLLIIVLGLFLLISIPTAIFSQAISWRTIGIVTVVGVVLIGITLSIAGRNPQPMFSNLVSWLKLLPGIVLVLSTGIGLPILIVYLFGDGKNLLETQTIELASLGRLMQVGFISIASMLPAFLFYLFGRQQVEKQKENFYREAMLLDPNVWSDSEAKNKYEPLLNSVFDTGNSPFSVLLLVISTSLLVMGWIITLSPIGATHQELTSLIDFFVPVATPFTFGFLGAYFFTINMIYRRYVRADLTTKTYAYITMRLLVTLVLVWTVSTLPQFRAGSGLETGLFVVAFIIGIFPETGMALIQDQFRLITKQSQDKDSFSLTRLEGINLYDRARLLEEGIENIENLAHHNLMELIARTRIPTPRLVDMFDQAILYLHLGLETDENEENGTKGKDDPRDLLKSLGVRTATDLIKCKDKLRAFETDNKYQALVNKLDVIETALKDDEWLNYVQNWRDYSSSQDKSIVDPVELYDSATKSHQPPSKSPTRIAS